MIHLPDLNCSCPTNPEIQWMRSVRPTFFDFPNNETQIPPEASINIADRKANILHGRSVQQTRLLVYKRDEAIDCFTPVALIYYRQSVLCSAVLTPQHSTLIGLQLGAARSGERKAWSRSDKCRVGQLLLVIDFSFAKD